MTSTQRVNLCENPFYGARISNNSPSETNMLYSISQEFQQCIPEPSQALCRGWRMKGNHECEQIA